MRRLAALPFRALPASEGARQRMARPLPDDDLPLSKQTHREDHAFDQPHGLPGLFLQFQLTPLDGPPHRADFLGSGSALGLSRNQPFIFVNIQRELFFYF